MAKPRSLEAKLARLRSLRNEPKSPQVLQELRAGLADASNLIVAEATEIVNVGVCLSKYKFLCLDFIFAFDSSLDSVSSVMTKIFI